MSDHERSSSDDFGDAGLHVVELQPDLALQCQAILKVRPDGPFNDEDLERFAHLRREQPELFARLYTRSPALAEAVPPLDAATVRRALEQASKHKVVELFIDLVLAADLNPVEIDTLRRLA